MRHLVQCDACRRQYDASAMAVGRCFRCACGGAVEVRPIQAQDAAVVRCSSCGATREGRVASCEYCGSDFDIHEQDLETICPSCFARISDRARYCHHCATPIVPQEAAGAETERRCPACGKGHALRSRGLLKVGLSVLECPRCAGLWIGAEAFEVLLERAREGRDPAPDPSAVLRRTMAAPSETSPQGPLYRHCPVCSGIMNRSNYGRRSGVLVDRCRDHGIWLDAMELDRLLRWVKRGGETLSAEREKEEERQLASAERFRVEPKVPEEGWPGSRSAADAESGALGEMIRILLGV